MDNNGLTHVRNRVFISYSRSDTKYLEEFKAHLEYYIQKDIVSAWDDTQIPVGTKWKDNIIQAVNSTKVAVFLVSAAFLGSRFIDEFELTPLLKASEEEGVVVMSVILGPSAFKDTALAAIQTVNNPALPLNQMPRAKRDVIWSQAVGKIKKTLQTDK